MAYSLIFRVDHLEPFTQHRHIRLRLAAFIHHAHKTSPSSSTGSSLREAAMAVARSSALSCPSANHCCHLSGALRSCPPCEVMRVRTRSITGVLTLAPLMTT